MNKRQVIRSAVTAGLLLSGAVAPQAFGQASDALIDKLVDKGILTVKEANDLRAESDADFKKAVATRTGMPEWVNGFKLYGDVRVRYEQINLANGMAVDQNRFRYRIRPGLTVTMFDSIEAGIRLTSSEATGNYGGDPISGNSTFANNASKKFVYIDLAYGKWTPINRDGWTLSGTVGKMENPFATSDMVYDPDYTPEGGAIQASYALTDRHTLKGNLGAFVLQEYKTSSTDPWLFGAQVRWDGKYLQREGSYGLESSLGLAWYGITGAQGTGLNTALVPDKNEGNTRVGGNLIYQYAPFVVDAALTYNLPSMPLYKGAFPIKVSGEYMVNPGAGHYLNTAANPVENTAWWAGVQFGKAAKKGTWEIGYRYESLGGDAWYEELTDSDFGAATYTALLPTAQSKYLRRHKCAGPRHQGCLRPVRLAHVHGQVLDDRAGLQDWPGNRRKPSASGPAMEVLVLHVTSSSQSSIQN